MKKYKNKNLSKFDKGRDKYWTNLADNFFRYKKNGWNTDKKFSEQNIKQGMRSGQRIFLQKGKRVREEVGDGTAKEKRQP